MRAFFVMTINTTFLDTEKWPYDPKFQDFANFLGLSPKRDAIGITWPWGEQIRDKIKEIYLWGKIMSGSADHETIKERVYSLKRSLGTNSLGETLVHELWQYTKFDHSYNRKKEELVEKGIVSEEKEIPIEPKEERPQKAIPAEGRPIKQVTAEIESPPREIPIKEIKFKKEIIESNI